MMKSGATTTGTKKSQKSMPSTIRIDDDRVARDSKLATYSLAPRYSNGAAAKATRPMYAKSLMTPNS